MNNEESLKEVIGKTALDIQGMEPDSEACKISFDDGSELVLWHDQECCETACIVDVAGEPFDLVGSPLLLAEESSSIYEYNADYVVGHMPDSWTLTFYRFATINGYVTLRWLGLSNGHYSERVCVDFYKNDK